MLVFGWGRGVKDFSPTCAAGNQVSWLSPKIGTCCKQFLNFAEVEVNTVLGRCWQTLADVGGLSLGGHSSRCLFPL